MRPLPPLSYLALPYTYRLTSPPKFRRDVCEKGPGRLSDEARGELVVGSVIEVDDDKRAAVQQGDAGKLVGGLHNERGADRSQARWTAPLGMGCPNMTVCVRRGHAQTGQRGSSSSAK
jgi:hypothetical protein